MTSIKILCAGLLASALTAGASAQTNAPAPTNAPATSASERLSQLFGDESVARGKGFEIKRSNLESAVINFKGAVAARGQPVSPPEMARAEQQLLQQLIRLKLLTARATDADRANGKEAGEKRFQAVLDRAGSEDALTRQLKAVGITPDELRVRIAEEAVAEAVVEREVPVTVTDDEVRKFYDDNPSRFEEPEKVRASHILLGTLDPATRKPLSDGQKEAKRKQMDELLKRAKAGEDFAALAREYSEDPGSKERGGEYPPFARGQMVPEFEATAFSLGENQISDVVVTSFGYHIIKLHERIPARTVEFAVVTDRIREALKQQAVQKELPAYFEKLYKDAAVEILDEKLKPSERDTPVTGGKPGGKQ
jgi:peptidyl-prolyl cis-trans isomerase C